jgi:hypothetical protein
MTYPIEEWNGGKIQRIRPSVIHLMRGQVFELVARRVAIRRRDARGKRTSVGI